MMIGLGLGIGFPQAPSPLVTGPVAYTESSAFSTFDPGEGEASTYTEASDFSFFGISDPAVFPWGAYWDADNGVALSGSDVASWTARIGSYVLAPSATKPTLNTTGINGKNAVAFVTASSEGFRLDSLASLLTLPCIVWAQVQLTTNNAIQAVVRGDATLLFAINASGIMSMQVQGQLPTGPAVSTGTPHALAYSVTSTSTDMAVDGGAPTHTGFAAQTPAITSVGVGCRFNFTQGMNGMIRRLGIKTGTTLTQGQQLALYNGTSAT